jgi:hypothetical protein
MPRPHVSFEALWRLNRDRVPPDPAPNYCPFAEQFAAWAESVCARAEAGDLVAIQGAKVRLTDKFWEWRVAVPKRHRSLAGSSRGHVCLFEVFEAAYYRLKVAELALVPPLLVLTAPPTPPRPQIPALYLGDIEDG